MIYFYLFFCETLKLAGIAHQDIVLYIQKTKKTKEQKVKKVLMHSELFLCFSLFPRGKVVSVWICALFFCFPL